MKSTQHLVRTKEECFQPVGVASAEQRDPAREFDRRLVFGVGAKPDG
jgi:hypothetical protein